MAEKIVLIVYAIVLSLILFIQMTPNCYLWIKWIFGTFMAFYKYLIVEKGFEM